MTTDCHHQRGRHVNPGHRRDHTCDRHVPPYPPIHHTIGAAAVWALTLTAAAYAATVHTLENAATRARLELELELARHRTTRA